MNWKQRLYICSLIALFGYSFGYFIHCYFNYGTSFLLGWFGFGPLTRWIYKKLGD